jgi:hypothetical protein
MPGPPDPLEGRGVGGPVVGGRLAHAGAEPAHLLGVARQRGLPGQRGVHHAEQGQLGALDGRLGQPRAVADARGEPFEPPGHVEHGISDREHLGHVDAGDLAHDLSHRYS